MTLPEPDGPIAQAKNPIAAFNNDLPFDDQKAEYIPAGFKGHSISLIHLILTRRSAPKEEFETTAEYSKRVAGAKSEPIYKNLPLNSMLIAGCRPKDSRSYDSMDCNRYASYLGIRDVEHDAELGYDADNSKATISMSRLSVHNIWFGNVPSKIVVSFDLPREDAIRLKNSVDIVVLFRLIEPYIKRPLDSVDLEILVGELLEVWFFDKSNGRVVHKLKHKSP